MSENEDDVIDDQDGWEDFHVGMRH